MQGTTSAWRLASCWVTSWVSVPQATFKVNMPSTTTAVWRVSFRGSIEDRGGPQPAGKIFLEGVST